MTRQHQPQDGRRGPLVFWDAMQRLTRRDGFFTIAKVAAVAPDVHRNTVACYVAACCRSGDVVQVGERPAASGHGRTEKLLAVNVNGSPAPFEKDGSSDRLGRVQHQLWTTMRAMTSWTSQELALAASTDETAIVPAVARKYAAALRRAGYVQEIEPPRSRFHGRYRLRPAANTGPNPPVLRQDGSVVDRNKPRRA